MRETWMLAVVCMLTLGLGPLALAAPSQDLNMVYSSTDRGGYRYHRFTVDGPTIAEMARSPYRSQRYANAIVDKVWELADGMGSNLGKLTGKVYLAFQISSMAKESLRNGDDAMGVEIRSRTDASGKFGLELLDKTAEIWKELTGKE